MKIVFCSLRGSPGVTTLAVICAAQWPDPCVLLEADLHGGVLGQRYGLSAGTPNLVSLAATARHEMTEEAIWSSCRRLPDGVASVMAPERPEEVRRGLEQLPLSSALDGLDLLIDGGRYRSDISRLEAEVVVVVANPILEQLNLLISLAPDVVYGARLGVVLAGRGPYQASEVADQLQETCSDRAVVLGSVPHDPKGAKAAVSEGPGAPITRRSRLYRAAGSLVKELAGMRRQAGMHGEAGMHDALGIHSSAGVRSEVMA